MELEGSIELPAEANPLTEGLLYHALRTAASSDPHQIQTGTKQLQTWETSKGYYSLLQSVFLDRSLPLEVRYLAIIQLKNGIDKYWRRSAKNAVSKEEKAVIRSRLIEGGADEANERLALQNALVVAKVIRLDYPTEWPDALGKIIELLRASAAPNAYRLHLPRTLLILLQVVKELASGRLIRTRNNLQSITPEIFQVLGQVYMEKVQKWQSFLRGGGDDEGGALDDIEQSLLAMKVLRRLLIAGYAFPNRDSALHEFWSIIQTQLGELLAIVSVDNSPLAPEVRRLIEKHLAQFAKLHLAMAQNHPAAFVLLPDSISLVRAYWSLIVTFGQSFGVSSFPVNPEELPDSGVEDDVKPVQEVLAQKGLTIIRACVKMVFNPTQTFRYHHTQEKEERAQAVEIVKSQLLTQEFVQELMEITVTRFFVFRPRDVLEWQDEPEEWENQQTGESEDYEFAVRPCAEKLFLDLAINFKELITQPLLNVFYNVATPANHDIKTKDSVYTAVGLAAPVLRKDLDFEAFISNTLVPEVQIQGPGYNYLRRRIAILLGQWISVRTNEATRPLVYQIFQHLLDRSDSTNDIVVRITAGREFKNVADEWEFKAEDFLPYASKIITTLMELIEEVSLSETKMALLNTISILVLRLEHHVTPFAERIVRLLPPLWEQSGQEHLMKQAILTILARLITSMKAESQKYHPEVLPLIKMAIEPGSESQVYLLDDALDLWAAVLAQTSAPFPELLSLAPYLIQILDLGSEAFRQAIEIFESYVLVAPEAMLADHLRTPLLTSLASILGTLRPDVNGVVIHLVEIIIRAAHEHSGEQAVQVIVGDMINTGFFAMLMLGLKGSWQAHQRVGASSTSDPVVDGIIETDYFSVLARIATTSPRLLLEAINTAVGEESLETTMKWLLEEWFGHFENIGDPARRKLMAIALTRLLETGADWILIRLQDLMTMWTDLVIELTDGHDEKLVDCLVYRRPENPSSDYPESPEDMRRSAVLYSDPVHTINIVAFISEHLKEAIAASGGEQAFQEQWLVNVDKEIVQGFMQLPGLT